MGASLKIRCPHCNSKDIVKNGHHYGGKLQFLCRSCNKHFTLESARGYPPTNIPFPVVAYLLYFRRKVPVFSDMRKYRKFVNYWLKYLRISKDGVSRQTIHHWIKNFDPLLDDVISFDEASGFCHDLVKDLQSVRPAFAPVPYRRSLRVLEKKFGKEFLFRLLKDDEAFFKELVGTVSKDGVFSWDFEEGLK